jgi:hypothetical protein
MAIAHRGELKIDHSEIRIASQKPLIKTEI